MAEQVIFPLSEETGRQILAALRRIAVALEGGTSSVTASVNGTDLSLDGAGVSVDGTDLRIDGASVTVDGTDLSIG